MYRKKRFSERFSFDQVNPIEIKIRHEAPQILRGILPILALVKTGCDSQLKVALVKNGDETTITFGGSAAGSRFWAGF